MIARLVAAARRWGSVALFGWHDRCIHPGCLQGGSWAHPDGGPGGLCDEHVRCMP